MTRRPYQMKVLVRQFVMSLRDKPGFEIGFRVADVKKLIAKQNILPKTVVEGYKIDDPVRFAGEEINGWKTALDGHCGECPYESGKIRGTYVWKTKKSSAQQPLFEKKNEKDNDFITREVDVMQFPNYMQVGIGQEQRMIALTKENADLKEQLGKLRNVHEVAKKNENEKAAWEEMLDDANAKLKDRNDRVRMLEAKLRKARKECDRKLSVYGLKPSYGNPIGESEPVPIVKPVEPLNATAHPA